MNLSILCRALGTPRFRLFAVCRALSYHQEFYPLWGSQINGKCENANKAFVVSSFPHNSTNLNKCCELQAGATSLAGTPLWCDKHESEEHCQCHPCHTAGGGTARGSSHVCLKGGACRWLMQDPFVQLHIVQFVCALSDFLHLSHEFASAFAFS